MDKDINIGSLLRLIGVMAVAVGAAWALQVLDFHAGSAAGTLAWIVGAATIAGAGTGLFFATVSLPKSGAVPTSEARA